MEEQSCGKEAYSTRMESDDTHKSKSISSNFFFGKKEERPPSLWAPPLSLDI